uniref:SV short D7 protein 1 n=1 Tax=Simulium nigrimanum TaxID=683695 RepID=D1FQ58_SIMNI
MKFVIVLFFVIVAVSGEALEVKEARNVELSCDKMDGCFVSCNLLFWPSYMRDANHLKYQEKHNQCIQSASGKTCERNQQIKDCFIKDEPDVDVLEDEELAEYTIYWHENIEV